MKLIAIFPCECCAARDRVNPRRVFFIAKSRGIAEKRYDGIRYWGKKDTRD